MRHIGAAAIAALAALSLLSVNGSALMNKPVEGTFVIDSLESQGGHLITAGRISASSDTNGLYAFLAMDSSATVFNGNLLIVDTDDAELYNYSGSLTITFEGGGIACDTSDASSTLFSGSSDYAISLPMGEFADAANETGFDFFPLSFAGAFSSALDVQGRTRLFTVAATTVTITLDGAVISDWNGRGASEGEFFLQLTPSAGSVAISQHSLLSVMGVPYGSSAGGVSVIMSSADAEDISGFFEDFQDAINAIQGEGQEDALPPELGEIGELEGILPLANNLAVIIDMNVSGTIGEEAAPLKSPIVMRGTGETIVDYAGTASGVSATLSGDYAVIFLGEEFYSPNAWYTNKIPLPQTSIGLWSVAIGAFVLAHVLVKKKKLNVERSKKARWPAIGLHLVTAVGLLVLWDFEVAGFFGTSILTMASTGGFALPSSLIGAAPWAVVIAIQMMPLALASVAFGLPASIIANDALRFFKLGRKARGVGHAVGDVVTYTVGSLFILPILNLIISQLVGRL
ncbi:MAG: hypothetical protein CVT48_00120 [Thermoplasmata archaeon HGW-Thermoplasmata-1]|nr:MAG: hypothetical protein CVT48_00120 [Thermoplasmata archaeon HGW-Thermoplasmata-1]